MGSAIDGLVTGMSTTDMISQLMKLEAIPQTAIKTKASNQAKIVAAYQSVNSKMANLLAAAKAVTSADSWGAMKATSTSDAAVATAGTTATEGSLIFKVDKLATKHMYTFPTGVTGTTGNIMSGSTLQVRELDGSQSANITPTDKSLGAVVTAINAHADAAYTASAIQISPGQYTLQLTAKSTGAAAVFASAPTAINLIGSETITTQGINASITIGSTNPYVITSATNTFTDIMPGVTVTAMKEQAAADPKITVTIGADPEGMASKVQAMVDAANAALTDITAQSRTKTPTLAAGPLTGDSAVRKITQDILSAVGGGAGSLGSLSAVGVALDRSGKITFDRAKFLEASAADPALARSYFDKFTNKPAGLSTFEPGWDTADGIAGKLQTIAAITSEGIILPTDPASKAKEGVLSGLITRKNDFITSLNAQVANWDIRLAAKKTAMTRQYASLEVALGKMQSQSNWLAGQLGSLA